MLTTFRMASRAVLQLAIALAMGFAFSTTLMKGLLPDSWAMPDAFIFGAVFFLAFHWARWAGIWAEGSPTHGAMPQSKSLIAQLMAGDQRHVFRGVKGQRLGRKNSKLKPNVAQCKC